MVVAGEIRRHATAVRRNQERHEIRERPMKNYRVVLKGRRSTAAISEWRTRSITVQAWDKGEAKVLVGRKIRNGFTIDQVKCDHVVVADLRTVR
jgi:hypothetical protein